MFDIIYDGKIDQQSIVRNFKIHVLIKNNKVYSMGRENKEKQSVVKKLSNIK